MSEKRENLERQTIDVLSAWCLNEMREISTVKRTVDVACRHDPDEIANVLCSLEKRSDRLRRVRVLRDELEELFAGYEENSLEETPSIYVGPTDI